MVKMKKWLQEKKQNIFSKNKLLAIFLIILLIPTILTGLYLATEIRQNLFIRKQWKSKK